MTAERLLKIVLRVTGAVSLLAIGAVVMPRGWMAAIHEWLGLGRFPDAPIVGYLARSLSAFYALFGGLLILAATDIRRHGPVITYVAIGSILFSLMVMAVALSVGMPLWWALMEGPWIVLLSVCILVLQRKASRDAAA